MQVSGILLTCTDASHVTVHVTVPCKSSYYRATLR